MHRSLCGTEAEPFDPHGLPCAIIGLPRHTQALAQQLHFLIAAQAGIFRGCCGVAQVLGADAQLSQRLLARGVIGLGELR